MRKLVIALHIFCVTSLFGMDSLPSIDSDYTLRGDGVIGFYAYTGPVPQGNFVFNKDTGLYDSIPSSEQPANKDLENLQAKLEQENALQEKIEEGLEFCSKMLEDNVAFDLIATRLLQKDQLIFRLQGLSASKAKLQEQINSLQTQIDPAQSLAAAISLSRQSILPMDVSTQKTLSNGSKEVETTKAFTEQNKVLAKVKSSTKIKQVPAKKEVSTTSVQKGDSATSVKKGKATKPSDGSENWDAILAEFRALDAKERKEAPSAATIEASDDSSLVRAVKLNQSEIMPAIQGLIQGQKTPKEQIDLYLTSLHMFVEGCTCPYNDLTLPDLDLLNIRMPQAVSLFNQITADIARFYPDEKAACTRKIQESEAFRKFITMRKVWAENLRLTKAEFLLQQTIVSSSPHQNMVILAIAKLNHLGNVAPRIDNIMKILKGVKVD